MITIVGPGQRRPPGSTLINTTSRSDGFGEAFSPFRLGPVRLWGGHVAQNVENAWQFSKVYEDMTDTDGAPTAEWLVWAKRGWADRRAHRYPRGKGARPLYSWWDGEKLDYVEARKRIYIPAYAQAVLRTADFATLERRASEEHLALFDFDGYRLDAHGMTLLDAIENEERAMGHAFVLKLLIENGRRFDIDALVEDGLLERTGRRPARQLKLL